MASGVTGLDALRAQRRRIGVFCGSSSGNDPAYSAAARELGAAIAERGLEVVYGGGSAGLMGEVASGALGAGGAVIGVLPEGVFSDDVVRSPARDGDTGTLRIEVVPDMHARKARFHALAATFVALPGGIGTLEEWAEVVTWNHIGLHDRRLGFLDVSGYYRDLFAWMRAAVEAGFVPERLVDSLTIASSATELLAALGVDPAPSERP